MAHSAWAVEHLCGVGSLRGRKPEFGQTGFPSPPLRR